MIVLVDCIEDVGVVDSCGVGGICVVGDGSNPSKLYTH